MDEREAAQKGSRGESSDVAYDPSANRDDGRAAVGLRPDQCVVDAAHGAEMFEAFTVGQQDRILAADGVKPVSVQPPEARARYDESPPRQAAIVQRLGQTIGAAG
jgi:hypothetical protein